MPTEILRELWGNWMFRLSLSSNELFHSNFLHTLFSDPDANEDNVTDWDRLQQCAHSLGLDLDWLDRVKEEYGQYAVHVHREWRQLDLAFVVHVPKQRGSFKEVVIFAVELKIKSYPTLEQLERYLGKMNEQNRDDGCGSKLVLLSLMGAPAEATKLPELILVDFGALAKNLGRVRPCQTTFRPALDAYIRLCGQLHDLSKHWRRMLEEPLSLGEVLDRGASYGRLSAIWYKLCAARLCALVAKEIGKHSIDGNVELSLTPGLSNSTWSADFLWVRGDLPKVDQRSKNRMSLPVAKVGVQVERDTIRFMMNASDIRPRASCARKDVENALLAQATEQGLFSRLMSIYANSKATATTAASAEDAKFWRNRGVLLERSGWPQLRKPMKPEFELTGYENSATFGHADYRLTLARTATLEDISTQVVAALLGDFNKNGMESFKQVLLEPGTIFN